MHFEFLIEDNSGKILLDKILPKIFPSEHTWKLHSYKGAGHLPKSTSNKSPQNRMLLANLPKLISGYGNTFPKNNLKTHNTSIVIILDSDNNLPKKMFNDIEKLISNCKTKPDTNVFLATEEFEAWLLGDKLAISAAYPKTKKNILNSYSQDTVCGTWEKLADAIYPGGSQNLKSNPFYEIGKTKSEWASRIGENLNIEKNTSPSFIRFRDSLRKKVSEI
jgi:hypothetical protein